MRKRETIRQMLCAGERPLDAGRVREVTELVLKRPRRMGTLIECLFDEDAGVANRAADVLERVTRGNPLPAARWTHELIGLMAEAQQKKLRWNLALTIGRMPLTVMETRRAAALLTGYLDDASSIVKTAAMQGLANLTRHDATLLPGVLDTLRLLSRSGTPAMRARGRILLKRLVGR
jgi:HEAT repeat protein